jgi:WD40 repeat protein/energy-coupling factor transporter ATP-binding protein EcfA2
MEKTQALQNLLNGTASEEDINLLKGGLASGEISIGGNVNQSVIIIGSGNTVELPPAALDRLGGRSLLGDLDRDLTGDEIASGLNRLEAELPLRAPVLLTQLQEQTRRLRPSLKTSAKSLSDHARKERVEALAQINSLCMEALDISFNALCLGEEPPEYDSRSPFRGLESFRPEDSEFFFGREALTRKLVDKINSHPFLAVLGASGSGKSSLIMAGLIPALSSDYVTPALHRTQCGASVFRPGTNPLETLEAVKENALVVVDQFEELFTLTRDESTRKEFIAKLLETIKQNKVVITLRSDFLGEVGAYRSLKEEIQSHLEIVPPMDMDELRRAMEGQAGVVGLRFEADLSQQILDDVEGEPGAMPLLQHALWELWNRRHGRYLRASEYRAFGGVKQAITSTAEKVYADCSKPEQDVLCDIFLRLTRLDDGDEGRDTRRRVAVSNLIPSGRDTASITFLLDKLANARLIVKTVNEEKTEIEVAHEALIRHWERLRGWLNEDRDNLRLRESVSEDARQWENASRDEALLNHRGGRLDDALLLRENSRYGLTEIEQAYLKACVALRNKEQRERERRLRYTVFASITAAIIFFALGSFGLIKSNEATNQAGTAQANANAAATAQSNAEKQKLEAERQSKIALARQLAAQAQFILNKKDGNQVTAVLLAVQSIRILPSSDAAQTIQRSVVAHQLSYKNLATPYNSAPYNSVTFSPDGKYVAAGRLIWDAITGDDVAQISPESWVTSVVFSPDGKYVISGGWDKTVRVWDAISGQEIARMVHDDNFVHTVAFSPDGKYVVSGSEDNTARVWEVTTGKEISRMTHDGEVANVAFSPDGKYVVSGSWDHTARVWESDTGREIARMIHDLSVTSVAFSPDGKYIISGSNDGTARVWETDTGREIAHMIHDLSVASVAFSPKSYEVASASQDGTVRIWYATTGREIARMTYLGPVTSVAFSPDGNYVVSGSSWGDYTARVLEVETGNEIARMAYDRPVVSVAFSPDSRYVVSGSDNGVVNVWEVARKGSRQLNLLNDHATKLVYSSDGRYIVASFHGSSSVQLLDVATGRKVGGFNATPFDLSPDEKYIVIGSWGSSDGFMNFAGVWEVATGNEIARMIYDYDVTSVDFSPDGKHVVSASLDRIDVWDATNGAGIVRMIYGEGVVNSVAFSPDGKYVLSGGCDQWGPFSSLGSLCVRGSARVWDAFTGNEIARMTYDGVVTSSVFSPDGKYAVSIGCDHPGEADNNRINPCIQSSARVWEAITGKEVSRITQEGNLTSVAFSLDGKYVVSGGCDLYPSCTQGSARVWEATTGKEIARTTYGREVTQVAFSPDGKYIVSGSDDGTARVWDVAGDVEIAQMVHIDSVVSVAFSPDGQYVASGGMDNTIRMWLYRPEDIIEDACWRVTRNLTRAEWNQYIGDALPYQAVCPNLSIEPEPTPTSQLP